MVRLRAQAKAKRGGLQFAQCRTSLVVPAVTRCSDSRGWPQMSQMRAGTPWKDARHFSQIGTRPPVTSSFSQRRQSAGSRTLASASPACESHLAALRARGKVWSTPLTGGQRTPFCLLTEGQLYRCGISCPVVSPTSAEDAKARAGLVPFFPGRRYSASPRAPLRGAFAAVHPGSWRTRRSRPYRCA